jgi:ferredoxin-type protein NapH
MTNDRENCIMDIGIYIISALTGINDGGHFMKRQKVRKALILISFFLFPATIFYMSPALIIQGVAEGIISGSFLLFAATFLCSLVFGRVFCGWICPAGGLQESCFAVQGKKAGNGRLNWIKYFIWVPWVGLIVLMAAMAGGLRTIDPLYQTKYGLSVTEPGHYVIYFGVVGLIVILALSAGKRAFCHHVCWAAPFMVIGTWIRNKSGIPGLKLAAQKEKCVNCGICTRNCPMSLEVQQMVQKGNMTNSECILCGECVDGCNKKVIRFAMKRDTPT